MAAPANHFTAFVDRLAADLDTMPARAEDMAAAAHLSRFHFERVIPAVAGESPTRFRARILLERAAYRMTTTDGHPARHRASTRLRLPRGVHPRLPTGVRRRPVGLAGASRPVPDRGAQRRALPPARWPSAAGPAQDGRRGPGRRDGRAPRLAGRRAGRPRARAHRRAARRALRRAGRGHRRRLAALGPLPADRPDGDVVRRRGRPRVRLRGRAARVGPSMRRAARRVGPEFVAQVREVATRAASTRPSSTRSRRPRRCCPTAPWSRTC